jgi:integrase
MLNINYNLRDPKASKETPINIVLRYKELKLVYPSGMKINPIFWNKDEQKARQTPKFSNFPQFNRRLELLATAINLVFDKYLNENENKIPSIEIFKQILDIKLERVIETKYTFFTFFQKYIDNLKYKTNPNTGKLISKTTICSYQNTLNILIEFQKVVKRKIVFENIDMDFYFNLIEYLTTNRKQSTNTIGKIIKNIKVILNDATENELNTNLSYKSKRFVPISEKSFSIYLNEKELTEIHNLDLSQNKKLEVVRDLFLIGCYTGLRYSDYSNIKTKNIDIENNLLEIQPQKTDTIVLIPLHNVVKTILCKYNYVLPKSISNQKTNDYLKEIGIKAELLNVKVTKKITKGGLPLEHNMFKYELLCSHTARRSFATNLYLSGFPSISIMKITGHTTEKSFMKYIKVTPKENAKLLQLHWNKETTNLKIV